MPTASTRPEIAPGAFRHEALFYSGIAEFLDGTSAFLREGVSAGQPAFVVVSAQKIEALRDVLGPDAASVQFADMAEVGHNPARIIPAWNEFVERCASDGRAVRGIGEPIFPERSSDALVECQLHESLLNTAFGAGPGWWLVCPYDLVALPEPVIDEAYRSHRYVAHGGVRAPSDRFLELHPQFEAPLPEPDGPRHAVAFSSGPLDPLRDFVAHHARAAGLDSRRAADFVLAAHEIVTNSIRHGGGAGTLRVWAEGPSIICEIRDSGHISDPMAGRRLPGADEVHGRGLWLANWLCDLVQVRTSEAGTIVRLHMGV